jgi:hypothetical protein
MELMRMKGGELCPRTLDSAVWMRSEYNSHARVEWLNKALK